MLVGRVRLPNKPLVVISSQETVYVGDAHGVVYDIKPPYISPRPIFISPGPVSALAADKDLYYGNWDGDVGIVDGKKVNLGNHMVKCMLIDKGLLYVSVGLAVHVLDLDLRTKGSYEVSYKVLCMSVVGDSVYCGMGVSFLARIHGGLEIIGQSLHDTSILCISGEYTGSADGRVLKQDYSDLENAKEVYKGEGWIRSMDSRFLFSDGRQVMADIDGLKGGHGTGLRSIYSHEEDVIGMIRVGNRIISIGLDYCYCIFEIEPSLSAAEEMELAELMRE